MRLRSALVVLLCCLTVVVPRAGATPSPVGAASVYGLDHSFTLVGYTSLGQRGMNSPLAVAGRCAYVGDRYYSSSPSVPGRAQGGIAIVDISNPAHPRETGLIPPVAESTQRELRADAGLGILVVESYSPFTGGDPTNSSSINNLKTYDIRDCRHPKLLSTYDFGPRPPHEFFLWKDPRHPGRALAYVTFTVFSPDLMVLDLTDPAKPALAGVYDLGIEKAQKTQDFVDESGSGYTHSLTVSDDGTRAYMAGWDYGFWTLDTSMLANPPVSGVGVGVMHPVGIGKLDYGHNVHSAILVPGRQDLVLTQEDYANAGHGCPFGILRTARLGTDGGATQEGQFSLPENNPANCGQKNGTFSSHNPTLFHDLGLVTWYSGGLRAVDLTDPTHPYELGAYVPKPTFEPALRDARLFFPAHTTQGTLPTDSTLPGSQADRWTGAMWSYPVVQNGLVYVVDIDLGLYVLRYTGKHAAEVSRAAFVEGNSAPARYTASAPRVLRTAAQWALIDREVAAGPRTVESPYRQVDVRALEGFGFLCV